MEKELVNPLVVETEKAKTKCVKQWTEYEACGKRIDGHVSDHNCEGWYFDYWKCIDKYRAPEIMKQLK